MYLRNMLDQKDRDIDMLTQSHLLEVAEMKKQIDTLRNSMRANKGLMDTKMAAVVEVLSMLLSNSLGYLCTYVCMYIF